MTANEMIDLTQDRALLAKLYMPKKGDFSRVEVPALPYAILDGVGDPSAETVGAAAKALFTAIYPIRREARDRMGKAFVEAPLEVVYWAENTDDLVAGRRDKWNWHVQITLPVWAGPGRLDAAVLEMQPDLDEEIAFRWEAAVEGACVQYLHAGPMDEIPTVLAGLYGDYLPRHGLEPAGPYHEIYLDDFNRVAPADRRIIIRQPVQADIRKTRLASAA